MTEQPAKGPKLPKDQPKSGGKKIPNIPELTRKVHIFVSSGWGKWLVDKRWPLALVISILLAVLVSPHVILFGSTYETGSYTEKAIKAPRNIVITDRESTTNRQNEAAANILPIFDYSPNKKINGEKMIDRAFSQARNFFEGSIPESDQEESAQASARIVPQSKIIALESNFQKTLKVTLSSRELVTLRNNRFSKSVQDLAKLAIGKAMANKVVSNKMLLSSELLGTEKGVQTGITIRDLDKSIEFPFEKLGEILSLEEVYELLRKESKEKNLSKEGNIAYKIALAMVEPNLTFNKSETEKRRKDARDQVAPSIIKYEKNQLIVGEGVKITPEIHSILNTISRQNRSGSSLLVFLGVAFLGFIFLNTLFYYADRNISKFNLNQRDLLFLTIFTGFTIIMLGIGIVIIEAICNQFPLFQPHILVLALPLASAAMTVRFLLNSEVAVIYSLAVAVMASLMVDPTVTILVFFLLSCVVGAHFVGQASHRQTIIKAGLYTGFFNITLYLTLRLALGSLDGFLSIELLLAALFACLGGIISGLVVLSITPLSEWIFGYTSNIKLLELASLNHPLLKNMVLKAPGTYNHSTLVSSLSEGAAEAIGCNPLLAKVGALYHDVGKINKASYFYENLASKDNNKHDDLFPRMSGLILTSHVKEGVEMARRHDLGEPIVDIIEQHHGTSLIYYFYKRAKEREDPETSPVEESDYRYPGPCPQTREAAIVMLSDIVEASTRSLANKNPARIEQNVEEMIERVFSDGQLDQCDLTLKDLQKIARSFNGILNGVYHSRVQYDESRKDKETRDGNGNRDPKSAESVNSSDNRPSKNDRRDF